MRGWSVIQRWHPLQRAIQLIRSSSRRSLGWCTRWNQGRSTASFRWPIGADSQAEAGGDARAAALELNLVPGQALGVAQGADNVMGLGGAKTRHGGRKVKHGSRANIHFQVAPYDAV